MSKVKIEVVSSECRGGYMKKGDTFIVEDLCPPICHELWNCMYPYIFALQNNAVLDYGEEREQCFKIRCPDNGRVEVFAKLLKE